MMDVYFGIAVMLAFSVFMVAVIFTVIALAFDDRDAARSALLGWVMIPGAFLWPIVLPVAIVVGIVQLVQLAR